MELLLSENRLWPGGPGVKAVLSDRNGEWEEVLRESYIDALHENIHRHNPKPADIVKAIEELAAEPYNMNDQEIARRLRVSGGYISQHRSYSQLIPEVRKEVEAGRLSFRGTRQFFGRPPAWQQKKLKQLESKADHRNKLPAGGDKPARRRKKKAAQGRRRAATPAPQTTATSALDQFRIAGRGPLSKFLQHVHDFLTGGMTTAQWISCREAARPLLATVSRPKGDPSPRPAKRPATTHKDASIVHELHPDPAVLPGKATEKKRRTLKSPAAAVLTSRRSVKTHR
jgi:hypothetical protein